MWKTMVNGFAESWALALGTGGVCADGLQIWSSAKLYFRFLNNVTFVEGRI
jgi:hypothetical protein